MQAAAVERNGHGHEGPIEGIAANPDFRIGIKTAHEERPDRQGSARALAVGRGSKVRRTILAARPDSGNQVGNHSDKPSVGVVLGGARLARNRHVKRVGKARSHSVGVAAATVAQACTGSKLGNALKQACHGVGNFGAEDLSRGRPKFVEHYAVGVFDAEHDNGFRVQSLVAKGGVGANKLKDAHVDRTQRDGRNDRNVRAYAQVLRQLSNWGRTNLLHEVGGNGVDRAGQGLLEGKHSAVLVVGIAGAP